MNRNIRQTLLPILAAFIWGTTFSAQSMAAEHLGPFSFNCFRSIVAALFLLAVDVGSTLLIRQRRSIPTLRGPRLRRLLLAGACCGTALFLASYMQQLGMSGTGAGKAGFITALYVVIVPLLGLFEGKRPTGLMWCCVALAVAGLYFLCVAEGFSIVRTDLYIMVCAFLFSIHIMVIDHFTGTVSGLQMSCIQFAVVALLSGIGMVLTEQPTLQAAAICVGPILYAGIFSSGIAYTLQILAQKNANPTVVSLLLCLESVFAALGGAVLLHERLAHRELLGCLLMLAGVMLSQLPAAAREK